MGHTLGEMGRLQQRWEGNQAVRDVGRRLGRKKNLYEVLGGL